MIMVACFFLLLVLPATVLAQCGEVCYPDVGCFSDCYPFEDFPLPQGPEDIGTEFFLYSRTGDDIVDVDNINTSPAFDASRSSTIFVIHGFSERTTKEWIQNLKNELVSNGDYNVILVDWRRGALPDGSRPLAPVPGSNTRVVARLTRNLINAASGLSPSNVHCIGFSLGGHGCGFLGKEFGNMGRISALDPAGDIFIGCSSERPVDCCPTNECQLSPQDANFVDAIHTNAWGTVTTSGITHDVGNVDFWANKGETQPGCGNDLTGICSHERAPDLYIESVNSGCGFTSDPCANVDAMRNDNCNTCSGGNCQQMGYKAISNSGRGTYSLSTNGNPPYCIN